MDKEKWLYPAAAAVGGIVLTWLVQGYLDDVDAGADALSQAQIEAVVRAVMEEDMVTDGGLTFHKALDDHMMVLNELTTNYARDRQETIQFREDYREDQRITQSILRALSAQRPGDLPGS